MYKFKDIIKKARNEKKLTQQQLSELVDCGVAHITRIETGSVYPSVRLLEKIFSTLDIVAYRDLGIEEEELKDLCNKILVDILEMPQEERVLVLKIIDLIVEKNRLLSNQRFRIAN